MPFLAALTFLTVLPSLGWRVSTDHLKTAPLFFPLVGLLIGAILAGLDALLLRVLPAGVTSALVLVALLAITGGLHLDGLADTCDGVFVAVASREWRLEIMRDSRVGSYGVAGVVCVLLVQYAALAAVPLPGRPYTLLLMGILSRWAMGLAVALFPYAREEGMGTAFRSDAGKILTVAGSGLLVTELCLVIGQWVGLALIAATLLIAVVIGKALVARLSGLTGDTYGAINETVQAAVLVLAAAFFTQLPTAQ